MQKESTQTELRIKRYDQKKFEFKSVLIQILNFSKHVWVGLLDRGDHNEDVGVGFVGFGQTSKLRVFEVQGLNYKEKYLLLGPWLQDKKANRRSSPTETY